MRWKLSIKCKCLNSRRKLYPGQRTNVILMTMCDYESFNFMAPSFYECCIWYNFLDAQLIITNKDITQLINTEGTT